ncbi:hypothetical protein ACM55F_06950 [Flavobacterium sp. XS2P12]|uniref:hypothetical protein n=1 Tax=Flavobacterium melibiosi TaxID=3398734 RepID=UPI003A871619
MKKSILLVAILATSLSFGQNTFPGIGNVGIGTTNPKSNLEVTAWTTALTIGSTKNTEAMVDNEVLSAINFYKHYNLGYAAAIKLLQAGDGNQYSPAHLAFYTTSGGSVFTTVPEERMRITSLGNVGIGTINPDTKLTVKGKIHAEEIIVDLAVPADYVFQKYYTGKSELKSDYSMPTLAEIESFTKKNHHLPNVPSAQEVQQNGVSLGMMSNVLLQKVEELTLYAIEQQKKLEVQNKTIATLAARLASLEKK